MCFYLIPDQGAGVTNLLSPTNIFNYLQTNDTDALGLAEVVYCRKVRQYWASGRVLDARKFTLERDDPILRPRQLNWVRTYLFDLTADGYFSEGRHADSFSREYHRRSGRKTDGGLPLQGRM